jgi:hypothetical protein
VQFTLLTQVQSWPGTGCACSFSIQNTLRVCDVHFMQLFCCLCLLMLSLYKWMHPSKEGQCMHLNCYCNVDACIVNVRQRWARTLIAVKTCCQLSVVSFGSWLLWSPVSVAGCVHVIQLCALVQVHKTEISINVYFDPASSFSQLTAMFYSYWIVVLQCQVSLLQRMCLRFCKKVLLLLWVGSVLLCTAVEVSELCWKVGNTAM